IIVQPGRAERAEGVQDHDVGTSPGDDVVECGDAYFAHTRRAVIASCKGFMAVRVHSPDHDVLELRRRKIVMPGRRNKFPLKLIRIIFAIDVEAAFGVTPDHIVQERVSRCCRAKKGSRVGGFTPATLSSKNADLSLDELRTHRPLPMRRYVLEVDSDK